MPNLTSLLTKLSMILLVILIIGLPANNLWQFLILSAAVIAIWVLPVEDINKKRLLISTLLITAICLLHPLLPRPTIEEGSNAFLPDSKGMSNVQNRGLPPQVYQYMLNIFDTTYPLKNRCDDKILGCWRNSGGTDAAFSSSLDDIYRPAKYSRVVDSINFTNLTTLRAGFTNEPYHNWWSSDIPREAMPFFVMYEINDQLEGSQLCWQGTILWQKSHDNYSPITHPRESSCKTLSHADIGKKIFGISISPKNPLAARLILSSKLQWSMALRQLSCLITVIILLVTWLQWKMWRQLLTPAVGTFTTLLLAWFYLPDLMQGYKVFEGGNDGLMHEGYGRAILRHILAGEINEALMGEEPVFALMPGLRYLRALGLAIFGETNFGYLAVILCLPWLLYGVAKQIMPSNWSLISLIICLPLIGQSAGFAASGFPDPMGYTLFLGSLCLMLPKHSNLFERWSGHALLALAIFVRPNLAIAGAFLLLLRFYHTSRTDSFRHALIASTSFFLILLMPLHNIFFGHQFVLLTSASDMSVNLKAPPSAYLSAAIALFDGKFALVEQSKILSHFQETYKTWLIFLLTTLLFLIALKKRALSTNCITLYIIICGLYLPFLFYISNGRYHLLAWMLAFIAIIAYLQSYWQTQRFWRLAKQ